MTKSLIAGSSILSVQGVASFPTDGAPLSEIIKIVVQLVIGAVSIFHMFKKPKEVISNQNKQ